MRTIFTVVLMAGSMLATAAMADDYMVVPKASQKFKAGPGNFYTQDLLLDHKNAQSNITRREKSGLAEVHAAWEDHIFILEGECTMMLGGTVENAKSTGPGETRGDSAKGAKSFPVHAGDYIYVPVNTPHQMILAAGKSVKYAVVKNHP